VIDHKPQNACTSAGTFARTRRRTAGSAECRRGPYLWSLRRFASPRTAEGRATSFQRTTLVGSAGRVLKQISQRRNSARYCRTCAAVRGDGCGYRQPFIEPRIPIRGLERQTTTPTCRSRRGPERPVSLVVAPFRVAENRRRSGDKFHQRDHLLRYSGHWHSPHPATKVRQLTLWTTKNC